MATNKHAAPNRTTEVLRYWHTHDYPTVRSCQEALQISSPSVVVYHLHKLVDMGLLDHEPRASHAYRISKGVRPE